MRFGKIDYLNLLPFEVFMRQYPKPLRFQLFYHYKKSYPAHLNREFLFGRIDAGFVSSIMALRAQKERIYASKMGIIAHGQVMSVLCLLGEVGSDYQSATSNALLKVLGLKGRVLIGDRALKELLKQRADGQCNYIDMGEFWYKREHLPFVFGRLCVKKHKNFYQRLICAFDKKSVKIPQFLLQRASHKSGISRQEILEYLRYISYRIGRKEKEGMERFYRKLRLLRVKPPARF